jgi:hypothetical protein
MDAVLLTDVEHRDDVRVGKSGGGARFDLEPPEVLRVAGNGARDHLDRDLAAQARVARPVNLSHAARAERRKDLLGTQPRAG